MAVRTTMSDLITKVRRLIGDESSSQYTDQDIQDVLDQPEFRTEIWYAELTAMATISPGGTAKYFDFYGGSYWEGSPVLLDATYSTITPATSDLVTGHWTFTGSATPPYGPSRPVYAKGNYYDVFGAGAELADMWAGSVKTCVDYADPQFNFKLSQQFEQLNEVARRLKAKCGPRQANLRRSDVV